MSDTVNSNSTTGASAGDTGAVLQAITDLQSSLQDTQAKLNSLSENVSKISSAVAESANLQTTVQGASDPYENSRRDRLAYDNVQAVNLNMLAALATNFDAIMKQHIRMVDLAAARHWGTSPETANPAGK